MKKHENKRNFFNHIAQDWQREHPVDEKSDELMAISGHFRLTAGDTVLDIGCGTGRLLPIVLEQIGERGCLVAADYSENMLILSRATTWAANLLYIQCDALHTPVCAGLFDKVICFALFPHLAPKEEALNEFYRILKPGGHLFIAHQMSRRELNAFHKKVKGPVTKDLLPRRHKMNSLLKRAGFKTFSILDQPSLYLVHACK
jgi:ubiquinone/menaquinone biosynthesis C-methylase UbiE